MSSGFMKIQIIGNLGRDPEMRYMPDGRAITSFSVAVNDDYTNKTGELISRVAWFRVTVWEKRAEVCQKYLHKGSKVFVEGKPGYNPETGLPKIWTDQEGTPRCNAEITGQQVLFLSSKAENEALAAKSVIPAGPAVSTTDPVDSGFDTLPTDLDNIPF